METTDMAVVVSQGQNEIATRERQGLDIRPHRARMNNEDLAEKFKAADDPLRLVFVCAMWMTGFDAPSVSTIYLDRPMRNHSLMQTIARVPSLSKGRTSEVPTGSVASQRQSRLAVARSEARPPSRHSAQRCRWLQFHRPRRRLALDQ
jgi:hypothetical protein